MIVITIIVALSATFFPILTGYIAKSRDSSRLIALTNIKKAIVNSYIDNTAYPTPSSWWCVPTTLAPIYLSTLPVSPGWSTYNEWCWPNGQYAYGTLTTLTQSAFLLLSTMDAWASGNYSGSTLGMTGTMTASGYQTASDMLQKWAGRIYIIVEWIALWSSLTGESPAVVPPPPNPPTPINWACSSTGCNPWSVTGLSGPTCWGGIQAWTCSGIDGGSSSPTCSMTSPACATYMITYDALPGTLTPPTSVTVTQSNSLWSNYPSSTPTRWWYSFSWWYTTPTWGIQITSATVPTASSTYYAQWILSPYASCTFAWQNYTRTGSRAPEYTISAGGGTFSIPACDIDDKIICTAPGVGYTWAMCNVGSSKAGTGPASYGSMFQWWRNVPFPSSGAIQTTPWPLPASTASATTYFISNRDHSGDWINPKDHTLWWTTSDDTTATYATSTPANQAKMQWPCAPGYHVPTYKEAYDTVTPIAWAAWMTTMNAPLPGRRAYADGSLSGVPGYYGYWWLSSTDSTYSVYGRQVYWQYASIASLTYGQRTFSFGVRCLKN